MLKVKTLIYNMRKNSNIPISVENAIIGVIRSLPHFEAEYISLLRKPGSMDKERIHTFEQYIECRLNNEFFSIPELSHVAEDFDGFMIRVVSVQRPDTSHKNRFSEIRAEINTGCPEFCGEDLEKDIEMIREFLGGTRITIVSAPRMPRITTN